MGILILDYEETLFWMFLRQPNWQLLRFTGVEIFSLNIMYNFPRSTWCNAFTVEFQWILKTHLVFFVVEILHWIRFSAITDTTDRTM